MKFQLFYIILYYAAFEIIVTYNNKELRKLAPIKFRFKLNPKTVVPVIVNKFANDKVKQIIDITANKTWTSISQLNWDYITEDSETYSQNGIRNFKLYGLYYTEDFYLGNDYDSLCANSLNWFLYDRSEGVGIPTGGLGLSRRFDDIKDDVIMTLYNNKKIESPCFAFSYNVQNEGSLIVGDLVDGLVEYPEYNSFLNVLDIDEKWRANLTHIFFGNETDGVIKNIDIARNKYLISKDIIQINYPAYFSTTDKYIIAPISFMTYLEKNYFKDYSYCSKIKEDSISKIRCPISKKEEIINTIKNLNFVFEETNAYIMKQNELFEEEGDYLVFIIVSYDNFDEWVMGYYFMSNYFLTFFRKTESISIYSFLKKMYVKIVMDNPAKTYARSLLIFIMLIDLITIIVLIYINKVNK